MTVPEPDMQSPTWPFVLAFAKRMEYKLSLNRHKGDRNGWASMDAHDILNRIDDGLEELLCELDDGGDVNAVANECADVANLCMMMADNLTSPR